MKHNSYINKNIILVLISIINIVLLLYIIVNNFNYINKKPYYVLFSNSELTIIKDTFCHNIIIKYNFSKDLKSEYVIDNSGVMRQQILTYYDSMRYNYSYNENCYLERFFKTYYRNQRWVKDGVLKEYSADGKMRSEISYKNNIRNDTSFWYFINNKVELEGVFKKGNPIQFRKFNERGDLINIQAY